MRNNQSTNSMKTVISKFSTLAFIAIITLSTSCEKSTPEPVAPVTPTPPIVVVDTLCDGLPNNTSYLPLAIGNKWTYGRTYNVPGNDEYTEEILSDTVYNGLNYYVVEVIDQAFTGVHYEKLYREDANGNVYELRYGGSEHLIIPGNPVVGNIVWDDYKVISTNASITAGGCSYTGCLQIMDTGFLSIYFYYKPGVGMIESSDYTIDAVSLN